MAKKPARNTFRQKLFFTLLIGSGTLLAFLAVILPILTSSLEPAPEVGQVATRDYSSPETLIFESKVLTDQRRDAAVRAVAPIYTSPDTRIARQKLESLRTTLAYITSVRADAYATTQQKLDDLAAMADINLDHETATTIIGLTDTRWQSIEQEAIIVLEKSMSSTIRPEGVENARSSLPALVSLSLPESQADIVAKLAAAFVAPNSLYSEDLTMAARQAAEESVEPVNRTLVAGQTIVSKGDVFEASDIEALNQLGLFQPEQRWPELVSALTLVLLLVTFLLFYLLREETPSVKDARSLVLIAILFLGFLFAARLTIPAHTVVPYIFPLAAYSLTVAALFGAELALISSLPLAILVAYSLPYSLDLTLYYMIGSLFGVLALRRARRMSSFFWAGIAIAVAGSAIVLAYRLALPITDAIGLATLAGASLFNGLASASITILLHFILAQFLGMTTPMQLMDLTRPDQPLLQLMLRDAPGTYQHSLQVANLAEQAAERIGADPLLTRVGALYHDIGKSLNPFYFIENQPPGFENPHNLLNPLESSEKILQHVKDGLELGKKYRLPRLIMDFITEHHGTMITRYQYYNSVKAAGGNEDQVDIERFRYPGPRPQSRETAILMLADGSEARVRAERPDDENGLRSLVRELINDRFSKGQLDDTNLTFRDLNTILDSFTSTLRGVYHPRIEYPKLEVSISPEPLSSQSTLTSDLSSDLSIDAPP